jgi:hypothetical protein
VTALDTKTVQNSAEISEILKQFASNATVKTVANEMCGLESHKPESNFWFGLRTGLEPAPLELSLAITEPEFAQIRRLALVSAERTDFIASAELEIDCSTMDRTSSRNQLVSSLIQLGPWHIRL